MTPHSLSSLLPLKSHDSPLLHIDGAHGREARAVLDLSRHGLRALDAALGHVEGDVDDRRQGAAEEAQQQAPAQVHVRILCLSIDGEFRM